jgi:beta-lactamase superfamily II metal-dependent hydrolase
VSTPSLTVLDVGHGNAGIVREAGVSILIDAARRNHVLEYLRRESIGTIDLVVISHSDLDHIEGLVGLLSAGVRIKKVRLNGDADKSTEAWRDLVFALEDARRAGEIAFEVGLSVGTLAVEGLSKCQLDVVAPTPGLAALGVGARDRHERRITSNTISACIRVLYDGTPVALLTGDMDEVSLDDSIEARTDLRAPVLVFPHHGGRPGTANSTAFAQKLMDAVKPDTVLFSIGRVPHENPRPEIVSVVRALGVYIACTQLSTHCTDVLDGLSSEHLADVHSAGATKRHCCAGTVVISLEATSTRFGTMERHTRFVKSVKTPMCQTV